MTDIRELLELAARAMGLEIEPCTCSDVPFRLKGERFHWCPDRDDGDCARMCATLWIETTWVSTAAICSVQEHASAFAREGFADHSGDRSAAWRLAALRVAAEIGKGMQG